MFVHDFQKSAYIDVRHLADRHIDEGLGVDDFHLIFADQLELHDHDIVLDILQIDIFRLLL